MEAGGTHYISAAALASTPVTGRCASGGPFCSERCKRIYIADAENKSHAKASSKRSLAPATTLGLSSRHPKEHRRILEMQKEVRESAELQQQREKDEEESRRRRAQAAHHRANGLLTLAFLVEHGPAVGGVAVAYLFVTFLAATILGPHKGEMAVWVWAVSGLFLLATAGLAGHRMHQEHAARKAI